MNKVPQRKALAMGHSPSRYKHGGAILKMALLKPTGGGGECPMPAKSAKVGKGKR